MNDQSPNPDMASESFLAGQNADYVEALQARHAADPSQLDDVWQAYFQSLNENAQHAQEAANGPSWARSDWPPQPSDDLTAALTGEWPAAPVDTKDAAKKITQKASEKGVGLSVEQVRSAVLDSVRALMIIRAYRIRGHLVANLDPLAMRKETPHPELDPRSFGFTDADMDRPIFLDKVLGMEVATLRDILGILQRTYCGTFALQFMHISDPEQVGWLKERIEGLGKEIQFTKNGRRAILNKLVQAEGFEKFLHVKYMGTKRFGLDGAETTIPAMEQIIKRGGALGVEEIAIGMPHRGRLEHSGQCDGQALSRHFQRISGRQLQARGCRRFR